jgi:hypothetical protein
MAHVSIAFFSSCSFSPRLYTKQTVGSKAIFGLLPVAIHMHMNGLMLIQIEEKPHPESCQQCRHTEIFSAKIGINFYTTKRLTVYFSAISQIFIELWLIITPFLSKKIAKHGFFF